VIAESNSLNCAVVSPRLSRLVAWAW
jgi:hypothetical protein